MVVGIGTDMVDIKRIREVFLEDEAKLGRVFTPAEISASEGLQNRDSYFAGRWALKEAISKALGTGMGANCRWQDLEILNDEKGAPKLTVKGSTLDFCSSLKVNNWHVSITHTESMASALAVAES